MFITLLVPFYFLPPKINIRMGNMPINFMTVWECQLKSAVREKTLLEVEYWINHSYLERFKQKPFRIYDVEGASLPIVAEGYMKYGKPE